MISINACMGCLPNTAQCTQIMCAIFLTNSCDDRSSPYIYLYKHDIAFPCTIWSLCYYTFGYEFKVDSDVCTFLLDKGSMRICVSKLGFREVIVCQRRPTTDSESFSSIMSAIYDTLKTLPIIGRLVSVLTSQRGCPRKTVVIFMGILCGWNLVILKYIKS